MDIKSLEYFVTLANLLNYTKASEILFISQPTLSRHINMLEEELGTKLFSRNTHQVELTPSGQNFLSEALKIVLAYKKGISTVKQANHSSENKIRIGYLRGGTDHILVPIFQKYLAEVTDVDLIFNDYNHIELMNTLVNGTNDLCFSLSTSLAGDESITLFNVLDLKTVLVVRDDHPYASLDTIQVKDFKDENYLYVEKRITRAWYDYVASLYLSKGYTPNFGKTCNSVTTLLMMVSLGYGVTILTNSCKPVAPKNLKFITIEDAAPPQIVGGYLESNSNPALKDLREWLQSDYQVP